MVYLNVYFNGVFQEQVALGKDVTTIGRGDENDIQIDNPGVSTQHAMVVREGDDYFVMDAKSKNGTVVNGAKVQRKKLEYGDMITILKHTLKYSPLAVQAEAGKPAHTVGAFVSRPLGRPPIALSSERTPAAAVVGSVGHRVTSSTLRAYLRLRDLKI